MSTKLGINNAKGSGGNGGGGSIEITKSYTIGYSEAQALMCGAMNSGIAEHTIVHVIAPSTKQASNGFSVGTGTTTGSISDTIKYGLTGATALDGSIQFMASTGMGVEIASFNDNGTIKYGLNSKPLTSITGSDNYGLTIALYLKPFITGTLANPVSGSATTKGTLKLLVWNTNTNEYETIEWTNQAGTISGSNYYKYNANIQFSLAYGYILCGILEAKIEAVFSGTITYITAEDVESMLA